MLLLFTHHTRRRLLTARRHCEEVGLYYDVVPTELLNAHEHDVGISTGSEFGGVTIGHNCSLKKPVLQFVVQTIVKGT